MLPVESRTGVSPHAPVINVPLENHTVISVSLSFGELESHLNSTTTTQANGNLFLLISTPPALDVRQSSNNCRKTDKKQHGKKITKYQLAHLRTLLFTQTYLHTCNKSHEKWVF